jgi:hypothetical protein
VREADFNQQQSYWERVNDNLARWLGVQHLATVDVVILVPLIVLFAIIITWWLPWERWWKDLPTIISGPYLLNCAFALWHSHPQWWLVSLAAMIGAGLCALNLKGRWKERRQS